MSKILFDYIYNKIRLIEEFFRKDAKLLKNMRRSIQTDSYSCAVQAVYVVLDYFDISHTHKEIENKLGTNKNEGTDTKPILKFFRNCNLKVTIDEQATLSSIKKSVDKKFPILITINDWEHWVIIYGYSKTRIFLMDSSKIRLTNSMKYHEFLKCWDDNWIAVICKQ